MYNSTAGRVSKFAQIPLSCLWICNTFHVFIMCLVSRFLSKHFKFLHRILPFVLSYLLLELIIGCLSLAGKPVCLSLDLFVLVSLLSLFPCSLLPLSSLWFLSRYKWRSALTWDLIAHWVMFSVGIVLSLMLISTFKKLYFCPSVNITFFFFFLSLELAVL